MKIKSLLASLIVLCASAVTVSAARLAAPRAPKISAASCSDLPLRVALLKAQEEMRALLPGKAGPGEVGRAMESDAAFSGRVKRFEAVHRRGGVAAVHVVGDRVLQDELAFGQHGRGFHQ